MTQALINAEAKSLTDWEAPNGGWASDGNEDIPPAFPIVSIVQPMSQIPKAMAGWFFHSDTEEQTADFDGVLLVRRETRALFVEGDDKPICRSDDGRNPAPNQRLWNPEFEGFVAQGRKWVAPPVKGSCDNCPFSLWTGDTPPICSNSYVIIAARNGAPEDLVQLRLKGTSIKPFRQWVSRKLAPKRLPMFFFQVHLTTEEKTAPSKKWHQLIIESSPLDESDVRTYSDVINAHRARIEHAVKEAGGEVEEWQDDAEEMPFE